MLTYTRTTRATMKQEKNPLVFSIIFLHLKKKNSALITYVYYHIYVTLSLYSHIVIEVSISYGYWDQAKISIWNRKQVFN